MGCRTRKVGMFEFCMTYHAAERALDMGITAEDIVDLLENPVETYNSKKYVALCVRNDKFALAMPGCDREVGHRTIVTILPHGTENWIRAQELGMLGEGRVYDPSRYNYS